MGTSKENKMGTLINDLHKACEHPHTTEQEATGVVFCMDCGKPVERAIASRTITDPNLKPTNPKDAIGCDKLPVHLWPTTASYMGCLALMDGALKYGRSNFRVVGVRISIYLDALQRHKDKYAAGQDTDADSGLPHLSHMLACVAIIVDAIAADKATDDREVKGGLLELMEQLTPHVARLKEDRKDHNPKHYTIKDNDATEQG